MRGFLAVFERELKSYFLSPVAYLVISLFLVGSGILFYAYLADYQVRMLQDTMQAQRQSGGSGAIFNVNNWVIMPFFSYLIFVELILIPLLTMRIYSDERHKGTLELLLTSPITNLQTILGKYMAVLTLFSLMILSTVVYILILSFYGEPEWGPIGSGYLGLLLHGAALLALGLMISSLTENQVVAALATFIFVILLSLIDFFAGWAGEFVRPVLSYMSVARQFGEFAKGVVTTKALIFYASFIFFSIFLTVRSIDSLRWR